MIAPVQRRWIGWGLLAGGACLVMLAVEKSTPDSAPVTATTTPPAAITSSAPTTVNPMVQQLAALDTRTARYATWPESELLGSIAPETGDVEELLNGDAAITVDGPANATENLAGWLRGWRTDRSEVLLTITTHPDASSAEAFARQNTGSRAAEYANGEASPRNWTLPAAEQLWVEANSDTARLVARYDTDVIIVTAHTPGGQTPPVALAAALLARSQTRLAPSPAPKRRSRIDAASIELAGSRAELVPEWVTGALPTRSSLYRIVDEPSRCLAYDDTDRYSLGTWKRISC